MKNTEEMVLELEKLKKENELLKQQVLEANEINKKKNLLISQISHEMRTPLNVVIGMASIATDELEHQDIVKDNLAEIENSSRILLGIVDNILDISALAGGTLKMDYNKFDLKEQITSLGIYFYEHAKYKGAHFDIHIKGVSEEFLIGDERRLQQIVTNLFSNSLKNVTTGGKIDLTVIQASSSRNRVHMRFVIQDTGRAMSETTIKGLFLPYEEKTVLDESIYADMGINLFVTKQLITALGGTVAVESRFGEGNKVIVDLPFQRTEQKSLDISEVRSHRVLVVADETVAKERGEMLADMGISYESVTDGYHALDFLGEAEDAGKPFSVCMVDMNMKGAYAEALISEIKNIYGKNPVVIATTYNSKEEQYKNLKADYTIENTLFRSTIFNALMQLEKGRIFSEDGEIENSQVFDFSRKRVLVVEDIPLNMEVLVKLLSKVNVAVVCAENGQEAYQTFFRKPAGYFDCIFMDINMPVMDGYEATKKIRAAEKADAKEVPIFAMTANAFSEDVTEALKAGMNGHIAKPIDVQILYKTLNKVFNGFENVEIEDNLLEKAKILEIQNNRLKEQAEHDSLTGLYNRYAYEKETYALMRKKEPVGFLLIDVDHFKEVNDRYGHEKGDAVLKFVADVIKNSVRKSDFLVRIGGDEFAIIIREYGNKKQVLFDKVEAINQILQRGNEEIPGVTISVGAAFSDIGYTTELYGMADKALYMTKKNGRSGCTIFDESKWSAQDEIEKMKRSVSDYMRFNVEEGRTHIGSTISLVAYRLLEFSIKAQLEKNLGAIKQKEIFRGAGFNAGIFFADQYLDKSCGLDAFVKQLIEKLEELKIGNLVLNDMDAETGTAILSVFEDADCSGMPSIGETVCQYDEGFIAGILSAYTNTKYIATEIECWAKGDSVCKFVAKPENTEEER